MPVPEWITKLRVLHQAARGRPLLPEAQTEYERYKDQLANVLLAAQGLAQAPGTSGRRTFRVGALLPLELSHNGRSLRTVTLDVSTGGFSTVADMAINRGERAEFTLGLQNAEKLTGRAKVAAKVVSEARSRISFEFEELSEAARARLEICLLDLALARIPE